LCRFQELQRFPKLHSQLVEVVSELLRERLGPTSDYTTSLISIQAAYINTNHPAFVAGSANIAREGAQKHQPAPSHVPSIASEGDDDEASVDHNVEDMILNGSGGQQRESRSVSETMHDRSGRKHRASVNALDGPSTSGKAHHGHDRASRRGQDKAPALQVQQQQQQGPGAEGHSSVLASSFDNRGSNAVTHRGFGGGASDILPELSARNGGHGSGVIGRFDQPQSTFDMKSLGKHLEPSPADPEHPQLSMREEMETNLIRSLICSYFSIVRQTIQDLVPKAVMHVRRPLPPSAPRLDADRPASAPPTSCSSTFRAKTSSRGS
jgi:dynamin 1-like protein